MSNSAVASVAPANALDLLVNGASYSGWTSMRVKRTIEELAWSFAMSYADAWYPGAQPLPIEEGDQCTITIDGNVVLTGYVDEAPGDYDDVSHGLDVTGRSCAGDLVDCSAIWKSGRWTNQTILQIAQDLLKPFNLLAAASVEIGEPLPTFSLEPGETVYATLDRIARLRGTLVISDELGNIEFTRAGSTTTATQIVRGVNVKGGSRHASWKDRFSEYILVGQSQGTDDWDGSQAANISATAQDSEVNRYRPLQVNLVEQGTVGLQDHVAWERNVRAGRSRRYTYRLPGWYCAEGLWTPNTMVHVIDDYFGLDDDFLIISATFLRNVGDGTVAELEVGPRESFDVTAFPLPRRHKRKRNEVKLRSIR